MAQRKRSKQQSEGYRPKRQSGSAPGNEQAGAKRRQASQGPEVTPEFLASLPPGTKVRRVILPSDQKA